MHQKVKLAAVAGFDAIEPWDGELKKHEEAGGSLKDLGKEIRDLGMFVPSVIGLWGGLAPSKEVFHHEIDQHKKRMQMISDKDTGFEGCVSLELYNPEYRQREPAPFLEEALRKTVSVVQSVG